MTFRVGLLVSTVALLAALFSPAESVAQAADSEEVWVPAYLPTIQVPPVATPIKIDGRIEAAEWSSAARTTSFTEVEPGDQTEPSVVTEAFITYDERHLYVAFRAFDRPSAVRASLRNRDEVYADDWVGIILDPYGDATRAYEIFANPLGIQFDLLWSQQGEDIGFDLIYHSDGRMTDNGYEVEFAIPFKSLRFPQREIHDWRVTFIRNHPRSSRHLYSWAAVSRDNPCMLCQLGTIGGMSGIESGRTMEAIPAVVGVQSSRLSDSDMPGSMEHGRVSLEPSLNLRYSLSSTLSAEATLNPDFSQVESDAAQIDVNETFALFFPERRPFFQEGSEMFKSFIDVVYTRSINSPITAAKLTGQPGRMSVGLITAVDERTPIFIPGEEWSGFAEAGRSFSTIARGRYSFGGNSFVGGVVSDRRYEQSGSGTEVGIDGQMQFLTNYRLFGQFVLSHSVEPVVEATSDDYGSASFNRGAHTVALDGESFAGHA
ncbi:MAG: DUF5916 domain-containing protein, partial [Bacteroidota bacterium]